MFRRLFRILVRIAWFLPGFLLWAAFPPMGERTDCLFALAPLLWLARTGRCKRAAWRWFLNGLVFWGATLSWMPAIVKNGGPWPLVALGWAALAAYCALYFGAFGLLASAYWRWTAERDEAPEAKRIGAAARRFFGLLVVEPLLWAGLELVRCRFLGGFAWHALGVVPVNAGFGAPAALGGVYLLSAVVILINGTVASIAERFLRRGAPSWFRSAETLVPFALVFALYARAPSAPADDPAGRSLKVAMVQRNFPCCFQRADENPVAVYSNLVAHAAALGPDLVVLSESAMAEFGALDRANARAFARYLARQAGGAAVLAGGGRYADGKAYNSAALYAGAGLDVYDKVHLVPFGEFIPGDKLFPALQKLAPVGSCTPGEVRLLTLGAGADAVRIGVAICFEDTDSALVREMAARGADLLCFITNDSWFSHSEETVQHAWQATARAIETGLPVVRVGNSGVTETIRPDGRATVLADADGVPLVDVAGTLFDRVALPQRGAARPRTPYAAYGDIPLAALFALLAAAMAAVAGRRVRAGRRLRKTLAAANGQST